MWEQNYIPVAGSLPVSATLAAVPLVGLLLLLGVFRKPSWVAALTGLGLALAVALFAFGMPVTLALSSTAMGAAFGLFPIGWILFNAILLYQLTVRAGKFEVIKHSLGNLTADRRLQALLIAFAFGAFLEGGAGFGSPVAVAAAMLVGLGFTPFYAAVLCLLANTAPVAFGSIGIPVVTLAGITGLPLDRLSAGVGRICAPVSVWIPAYLVVVMSGFRGLRGVWPAVVVCGVGFALSQFLVSNFMGPELTDIIAALVTIVGLVALLKLWKPKQIQTSLDAEHQVDGPALEGKHHSAKEIFGAWVPYLLLVAFVLTWGIPGVKPYLDPFTIPFAWPGLDGSVLRVAPLVESPSPYPAIFKLDLLAASGTACLLACIATAAFLGISPSKFLLTAKEVALQLAKPMTTICAVLGLSFLMNYSGATMTLGLAFAATGVLFPFFSALLGWLGVFLTGSDTAANALFGNLQVVTAGQLGLNPVLMAASNSSGGVMGKMISLQSIAVAVAAAGMATSEESRLFRYTLRHSVFLAAVIGLVVLFYAYAVPAWAP
ncbi:MAG: L-lactate permease [Bryobacterales bacterium]|jgi:lactate permease|nr:L-lactate permease [Bryobacterales bacterium]